MIRKHLQSCRAGAAGLLFALVACPGFRGGGMDAAVVPDADAHEDVAVDHLPDVAPATVDTANDAPSPSDRDSAKPALDTPPLFDGSPRCGAADGHCPAGCASGQDPDCKKPTGQPCSNPSECASGFCAGGYCCNEACAAPCRSCAAAATGQASGSCAAVRAGSDPGNHCTRASDATSCGNDGECDGAGGCRKVGPEQVCAGPTCQQGGAVPARRCTGDGSCAPAPTPVSCGNYVCAEGICKMSCSSDSDCTATHHCDGGACKPRCGPQSPSNFVPNAGFDRAIEPFWTIDVPPEGAGETRWDPMDAVGCPRSGSARVGPGSVAVPCLSVRGGATYHFGFSVKMEDLTSTSWCGVAWYGNSACAGMALDNGGINATAGPGWRKLTTQITALPTATHALLVCFSMKPGTYFDRVFLNAAAAEY